MITPNLTAKDKPDQPFLIKTHKTIVGKYVCFMYTIEKKGSLAIAWVPEVISLENRFRPRARWHPGYSGQ